MNEGYLGPGNIMCLIFWEHFKRVTSIYIKGTGSSGYRTIKYSIVKSSGYFRLYITSR